MNNFLTNIITNPKTQILIKKTQTLNYTKKIITKFEIETLN